MYSVIRCRHLYTLKSSYVLGKEPFESVVRPLLAEADAKAALRGEDCWSVETSRCRLSLYIGPTFDEGENSYYSYLAIDYEGGFFGTSARTEKIAASLGDQIEKAGGILVCRSAT